MEANQARPFPHTPGVFCVPGVGNDLLDSIPKTYLVAFEMYMTAFILDIAFTLKLEDAVEASAREVGKDKEK
eukprot:1138474-Pelagomonas_calceolata.AAC.6